MNLPVPLLSLQWDMIVQHIYKNTVFIAGYFAMRGHHLILDSDLNQPPVGTFNPSRVDCHSGFSVISKLERSGAISAEDSQPCPEAHIGILGPQPNDTCLWHFRKSSKNAGARHVWTTVKNPLPLSTLSEMVLKQFLGKGSFGTTSGPQIAVNRVKNGLSGYG